ncbi:MAG: flagellar type III secretion system pore protein FliP [Oscillospiraceae bacterium]|nr:flagellar type III secretion system pore protein FliP [Oscillospiraceae bacterium]
MVESTKMSFNVFNAARLSGKLLLTVLIFITAAVVCLTHLPVSVHGIVTEIPNIEQDVPQTTQAQEPPVDGIPPLFDAELPYELPVTDGDIAGQSLLGQLGLTGGTTPIDLIILITILSLAPSILIMMTCFARIIISFSLLRNAMGVQQTPPNQVMIGLALFLTLFIMSPVIAEMNEVAYQPYRDGVYTSAEAVQAASVPLKTWMLKQTSNDSLYFFVGLSGEEVTALTEEEIVEQVSFVTVVPAFLLSEIKTGFEIGFLLYLPFLVIDIIVATILMSMGMIMLPPTMISVPFKIMMFVLADGWALLMGSLVTGFNV